VGRGVGVGSWWKDLKSRWDPGALVLPRGRCAAPADLRQDWTLGPALQEAPRLVGCRTGVSPLFCFMPNPSALLKKTEALTPRVASWWLSLLFKAVFSSRS